MKDALRKRVLVTGGAGFLGSRPGGRRGVAPDRRETLAEARR